MMVTFAGNFTVEHDDRTHSGIRGGIADPAPR
jgi:hypothetical protein